MRIVKDNAKNEKITVTPEMAKNPVKANTATGQKPRHYSVPSAFFSDRKIYDKKYTEKNTIQELDKMIKLLNQFMTKVNPQFYDTIREQLKIKYVGEEKPIDVRLQMARRRQGLEAEGITTNPLLWTGATVIALLSYFKSN